jgi:hypothetical protein
MEEIMEQLKKNILKISKNYENLLSLSKESFEYIKKNKLEKHNMIKIKEMKEYALLVENKEAIRLHLQEKSAEYGTMEVLKIRDVMKREASEKEVVVMERIISEMLDKEHDFHTQLRMTLEMTKVMTEINTMNIEASLEVAKREGYDKTGSMILEQDF